MTDHSLTNPLCAECGEHANEHGAISHEFVAQDSKSEIDRIIKTVKTWPIESPPMGTYQKWIAKLVAEVEKLRIENIGLKRELGMLDDDPSDEPSERPCTCHPDDNPPRPCPRKYALSECRKAAAYREQVNSLALECAESTRRAAEKSGAVLVVDDKPYNESGGGG